MKKLFSLFITAILLTSFSGFAQVMTTSPAILQENSKNVVLTFHADKCGVAALQNLPSSTALYVHTGVITDKSNGAWTHVVTDWSVNNAKNKLNYVSKNTYTLNVGDINTYYGVPSDEKVLKLCFIARTAAGDVQTKDLFIDVQEKGFQMALTSDVDSYVISGTTTINFTVNTSENANISLKVAGKEIASATSAMELKKGYTFKSRGYYEVVATATSGSKTLTKSVTVAYPNPSPAKPYPGGVPKMGAVKNSDGTVTFCLAAPNKSSVILIPSWDDYQTLDKNVMNYQDYQGYRYFWTTVSGLDNKTAYPYYYLVDGTTKVGDPYAHLVLDPYNDKWMASDIYPDKPLYPYDKFDDVMLAVYQGNLDDYKFSDFTIPDHKNLVVYEMLFRDFTGENNTDGTGSGTGTIKKAIEKFDHIVKMGVNCVELMPIMEFNGNNSWGYNTNFYMAPDKAYGSPKDLKDFIELCHVNGIAVVLDIVFNQSDGLHPWYQMYPISSNPFYNENAPHDYSVLNDWKQDNPLVQQQWVDAIKYWMTAYNVDGFRFDLVKGLGDNNSYGGGTEGYNSSRVARMTKLHAAIKSVKPNGIHINENLAGDREENEMAADGQLNWSNINYDSGRYAKASSNESSTMSGFYAPWSNRTQFSTVSYAESHDEERIGYIAMETSALKSQIKLRMRRLGSVAATMLMTPGPKMIWQFAEVGADQTTKNSSGNDTSPKKVCWDYLDDQYRAALYQNYCELGAVRKDNADLFSSESTSYVRDGFANTMTSARSIVIKNGTKEIAVLFNPAMSGNKAVTASVSLIKSGNAQILSKSEGITATTPTFASGKVTFTVPGNSYVVIGTSNIAGVEDVINDEIKDNVTVYGGNGEIVILGEYKNANVYNVSGQEIGSLNVPAGLYIVKVDNKSYKVLVK